MKHRNLKKILFFNVLLYFSSFSVQAQMMDLMGSMAIGGSQTINDVKAVGQMNKSMQNVQFLNELQMKNVDISTTYFGNYNRMSTQSVIIGNTKVTFKPTDNGQHFEAYIPSVSETLCSSLIRNKIDNLVKYRFVTGGKSKTYTPSQLQGKSDICNGVSAIGLIFQ